jgi:diguanylate cyclase (GGDEF)-like protein
MVRALEADVDDFLTKPFDAAELRARLRSGARVLDLQEGLLRTQEELRHLATHDQLTGIFNRPTIVESLERELTRAARERTPVSVAIADLDHFKRINDNYGHAAGDAVLAVAAARMRSVLRKYDAIGRYGGEEFLVVLPACDAAGAADVATRILKAVCEAPVDVAGGALGMAVSVGVSTTRSGTESAAELIAGADRALYRAKAAGRNRIEQFASSADLSRNTGTPGAT